MTNAQLQARVRELEQQVSRLTVELQIATEQVNTTTRHVERLLKQRHDPTKAPDWLKLHWTY